MTIIQLFIFKISTNMLNNKQLSLFFAFMFSLVLGAKAQEIDLNGFNENSLFHRQVHKSDQLYKRTLWYRMDLREKQNRPFFANSNEITKIIIDAVKAGIIRPFENDSLKERMSYEKFIKNLTIKGSEGGGEDDFGEEGGDWGSSDGGGTTDGGGGGGGDDGWGSSDAGAGAGGGDGEAAAETGDESGDGGEPAPTGGNEYFAGQLDILTIKEDLIFDKKRSRMHHDIQAVTIKIPASLHPAGLEETLAAFSYKELCEQVFKDNPAARWYNNDNLSEHRNFMEAFELRLFSAHLYKFENWDNTEIAEMYGGEGKAAILAAQQLEFELIDFEQDFWEN